VDRQRTNGDGEWNYTDYRWRKHLTFDAVGGTNVPSAYTHFTNRAEFSSAHQDIVYFGYAGSTGGGGTITVPPEGITVNAINFDKPYTFTGGPVHASMYGQGAFTLNNNDTSGATTGRFDVAVIATNVPGTAATFNLNRGPIVFTKPHIGDLKVNFGGGAGVPFGLSGKDARFMTGPMTMGNGGGSAGISIWSEGALNAARIIPNDMGGMTFGMTGQYTDRFRLTGGIGGNTYSRGHVLMMEGTMTKADQTTIDAAGTGYVYWNGEDMADASQVIYLFGGTHVLCKPNAFGDAKLRFGDTAMLSYEPGISLDISGWLTSDSGAMRIDVGTNAVVFTNVLVGTGTLNPFGNATGSLTLRPPSAITRLTGQSINLNGGTFVLDYTDMPLENGIASNLIGIVNWTGIGGALHIKGKPTGISRQQVGNVFATPYGVNEIIVDANGGDETTLFCSSAQFQGGVEVTLVDANSHLYHPTYTGGHSYPYWTICTEGRWDFLRFGGPSGTPNFCYAMAYPAAVAGGYPKLAPDSDWPSTFVWSGEMVMGHPRWDRPTGGSLKADATEEECILDLNGGIMRLNALLTEGTNNVTVKNGILECVDVNDGWRFWVYGPGSLTLEADVAFTNTVTTDLKNPSTFGNTSVVMKNGGGLMRILGRVETDKPFVINRGSVAIGHNDSLGVLPATRSLNNEILVYGDATITPLTDGLDVARNIFFNHRRTLTVDVPADMTLTLSGVISNTIGRVFLCKVGEGTLVLSGAANAHEGGVDLRAGTLSIGSLLQLGHREFAETRFNGGVLRITGTDCTTIDTAYVGNWGSFDGGFDIDEKDNAFTIGSPITVKALGAFTATGQGTLVLEGGIAFGAGTTLRVVGNAEGNGGIVVDELDLGAATLEVVAGKDVNEVTIATVAGNYMPSANVKLPAGFALKNRGGKVTAEKDNGSLILVR